MRGIILTAIVWCVGIVSFGQGSAKIKEYKKVFKTYPFSDPDPIPEVGKVYPYYRFDGYTNKPVDKEWKVVELEMIISVSSFCRRLVGRYGQPTKKARENHFCITIRW